ncbi:DUF4230 domain-containing protein [bacterium]|nr:DUF4230 domain-containing protein [bacterium]MBU1614623.1 DUF4230 domain-containing protein [bacterium]
MEMRNLHNADEPSVSQNNRTDNICGNQSENQTAKFQQMEKKDSATKESSNYLKIFFMLLSLLILSIIGLACKNSFSNKSEQAALSPEKILAQTPIAELAVYDFIFSIITKASENESGNISLLIVSGELLGKDIKTEILYRGCVRMKYGVNLAYLGPDKFKIDDNTIRITLPKPCIIGFAEILNEGSCTSEVLAAKSNKWLSRPNTVDLEQRVRRQYQETAPSWVKRFGLEQLVRDRTKEVLKLFLSESIKDKEIIIEFDDYNRGEK